MKVVSVTEDFNQEPGNAIVTIDGLAGIDSGSLSNSNPTLKVAFIKPGSQNEFLGTAGWQASECWFGVKLANNQTGDQFKFAMSPELALEMESRSYELQVKYAGQTHTAVFHWPEVREPDSPQPFINGDGNNGSTDYGEVTYGFITESFSDDEDRQETDNHEESDPVNENNYQTTGYTPETSFDPDDYQPANFAIDDQFTSENIAVDSSGDTKDAVPEDGADSAVTEFQQETVAESAAPEPESTGDTADREADKPSEDASPVRSNKETTENQSPLDSGINSAANRNNASQKNDEDQTASTSKGSHSRIFIWLIPALIILILLTVILYLLVSDDKQATATAQPEMQQATPVQPPQPEPVQPKITKPAPPVAEPAPVQPSAPSAENDRYRVKPGQPTRLMVLENDAGEQIEIVAITQKPSRGLVNIEQNKQVMYTWLSDSNGDDAFRYRIEDAHGQSASATVTIMARD